MTDHEKEQQEIKNGLTRLSKIYAVGKTEVESILYTPVEITEKMDGSQFSFCRDESGKFIARSKNVIFDSIDDCDKNFIEAYRWASSLTLIKNYIYRGEVIRSNRHNVLKYDRIPKNNFVLFDVKNKFGEHLPHFDLKKESNIIDCDAVPLIYEGFIDEESELSDFLKTVSFFGADEIEGIVVRRIDNNLRAKLVSERFKEVSKVRRPTAKNKNDVDILFQQYKTEARWQKAKQHLIDTSQFNYEKKDIGNLMKRVNVDIEEECKEEIKDLMWDAFRKRLFKIATTGLADWHLCKIRAKNKEGVKNER